MRSTLRCPDCGGVLARIYTLSRTPAECVRIRRCLQCKTRFETRETVSKKVIVREGECR